MQNGDGRFRGGFGEGVAQIRVSVVTLLDEIAGNERREEGESKAMSD